MAYQEVVQKTLEKPMPSDYQLECMVLSRMMSEDPNCGVAYFTSELLPSDFYHSPNRSIFTIICDMFARGNGPINTITVAEQMKASLNAENPLSYLSSIERQDPTYLFISKQQSETIVKTLKALSLRRDVVKIGLQLIDAGQDDNLAVTADGPASLLDIGREMLEQVANRNSGIMRQKSGPTVLADSMTEFAEMLENYHLNKTDAIPTGFTELDAVLDGGGLTPQGLYFLGAAPKVGKTSWVLQMIWNVAAVLNKPVLVVSQEMRKLGLIKRLFAAYSGIPSWHMRPGMQYKEYKDALQLIPEFGCAPIFITDSSRTMDRVSRESRMMVEREGVELIVLDYLQLTGLEEGTELDRVREVGKVSRECKTIATGLNVPFFSVSALSRKPQEEGRRPELHDNAWASQIEYDAEAMFFLWNPNYKPGQKLVDNPDGTRDLLFIVAAQRNGPTPDLKLKFVKEYMTFLELDKAGHIKQRNNKPAADHEEDEFETVWSMAEESIYAESTSEKSD